MKKQAGGIAKLIENGLGKELSPADLDDAPISSFPDLTGENGESTIKCNRKQVLRRAQSTLIHAPLRYSLVPLFSPLKVVEPGGLQSVTLWISLNEDSKVFDFEEAFEQ